MDRVVSSIMAAETDEVKRVWQFVSQFVCWEYCRHFERYASAQQQQDYPPDLMNFFQDMVVHLTMMERDTDITKQEIAAKFLDELCTARTLEQFKIVLRLAETVKRCCPELVPSLTEFTTSLLEKLKPLIVQNVRGDYQIDSLPEDMIRYSSVASRLLPMPDILKICQKWNEVVETSQEINEEALFAKFRRELLPEEVPEILRLIESDSIYHAYLKSQGIYINDSLEHLNLTSEEADAGSSMFDQPRRDTRASVNRRAMTTSPPGEVGSLPCTADLLSVTTVENNYCIQGSLASDSVCRVSIERFTNTESSSCDFYNPPHFKKPLNQLLNRQRPHRMQPQPSSQSSQVGGSSSGDFVHDSIVETSPPAPETQHGLIRRARVVIGERNRDRPHHQTDHSNDCMKNLRDRVRLRQPEFFDSTRSSQTPQPVSTTALRTRRHPESVVSAANLELRTQPTTSENRKPQQPIEVRELPQRACRKTTATSSMSVQPRSSREPNRIVMKECKVLLVDCLSNREKRLSCESNKTGLSITDGSDDDLDPSYRPKKNASYEDVWYKTKSDRRLENRRSLVHESTRIAAASSSSPAAPARKSLGHASTTAAQSKISSVQAKASAAQASTSTAHAGTSTATYTVKTRKAIGNNQQKSVLSDGNSSRGSSVESRMQFTSLVPRRLRSKSKSKPKEQRKKIPSHSPSYITQLYKRPSKKDRLCFVCLKERKIHKESSFCCISCHIALCPKPCFVSYHAKRNLL